MPRARLVLPLLLALSAASGAIGRAAQDAAPHVAPFDAPVATPGGDLPGEIAIRLVGVADGLIDPVNVTSAGDGSGRLFVVERVGRIRVIEDGVLLEEPFLDFSHRVEWGHIEQGMLGLAFDPDYATNGFFYVTYTDYDRNGALRLARFTVSDDDPNRADRGRFHLILSQDQPFRLHNGGELQFGPDGYLYVAIGDGGRASAPFEILPPSLDNLLGKILRIDVHGTQEGLPYAIPGDNPFADPLHYPPQVRREIWAHGLRNPWQVSFDRATGDLYITDVGDARLEEINVQPADSQGGEHYGWNTIEGTYCWPDWPAFAEECDAVGVPPVATYPHDGNCAVVGIGVYRGVESPSLDGIYVNADFCSGRVWGLARDAADAWLYQELLDTTLSITGGGEDEAGELYLTACACGLHRGYDPFANPTGTLWRLVAADRVPPGARMAPVEPSSTATPDASATPRGQAGDKAVEGSPTVNHHAGDCAAGPIRSTIHLVDVPGKAASCECSATALLQRSRQRRRE